MKNPDRFDSVLPHEVALGEQLARFLHELDSRATCADTWRHFRGFAQSHGFAHVTYSFSSGFPQERPDVFMLTTLPADWGKHVRFNPTLTQSSYTRLHTARKQTSFLFGVEFSEQYNDIPAYQTMLERLADFGFRAAIGMPLRSSCAPFLGRVSLGNRMDREAFLNLLSRHGLTLNVAAWHFHAQYLRLFRQEKLEAVKLSPKQQEIVRLVGEGKLDKQIAAELGISFSAVRRRLEAALARLDLGNRNELAAEAVRRGLVRDRVFNPGTEETTILIDHAD
ncbi:MAG TPA: autoinducer binding domain-containing protein [Rhizobiaceae bacterium]|nr:autoinducer binding domain-containing protein [Rhizobiaceae bacterium]